MEDVVGVAITVAACEFATAVVDQMLANGFLHPLTHRKIVHILLGFIPMIFWPIFSGHYRGRVALCFVPLLCLAINLLRQGFKLHRVVQDSAGRYRSCADYVKACVGGLVLGTFTGVFFWTNPIGISTLSNLCVGDGVAGIAGRRFGKRWKLPYNKNKSYAGTIGMAVSGFLASILFTSYFSRMGMVESEMNRDMIYGYLVVSIASALVESHPWSTLLDDNITVPLASIFLGSFVF